MIRTCPDCKGTGRDEKKTEAMLRGRIIDPGSYVRCWTCHGNGSDPASYFDWHEKPKCSTASSSS